MAKPKDTDRFLWDKGDIQIVQKPPKSSTKAEK